MLSPVVPGPSLRAGTHRHPLTQQPLAAPELRAVSYNLWADQYASDPKAQENLFAYCPVQ